MYPWLFCAAGLVIALKATRAQAMVPPKGMLTGPVVAGAEPAKSTVKVPSRLVTVTCMRTGSVVMPSSSSQSTAVHEPCGNASNACARRPLGVRQDLLDRPGHGVAAELGDDLDQAALTGAQTGDLGVHVTDDQLGHAAVEADQLDDLTVEHAALEHLRAGEQDPLLVHVGRVQHVAGILGAEVHPMGAHADEPQQRVVAVEHRSEHRRVIGVGSVPVRVVQQHHITTTQLTQPDVLHPLAQRIIIRPQEAGESGRFRQQAEAIVVDGDAEVEDFVDHRVERRADQRRPHLLRRRHQIAAHHLHRRAIDAHGHDGSSMS